MKQPNKLQSTADFALWLNGLTSAETFEKFPKHFQDINQTDEETISQAMQINDCLRLRMIICQAQFTKLPLEMSMFVDRDNNGNLIKPGPGEIQTDESSPIDHIDHDKPTSIRLFEQWEYISNKSPMFHTVRHTFSGIELHFAKISGRIETNFGKSEVQTIEDLIGHDLNLTDKAVSTWLR